MVPGLKRGVKAGNFTHQTELFGPVLGLMRANNLAHAIKLANGTPYGLTAGLHSLDDREHKYWISHIEAGNLYINRSTTGAIVQRQPFGGTKASSFGKGAKAGGPNYVLQFMHAHQKRLPQDLESNTAIDQSFNPLIPEKDLTLWQHSIGSYTYYWKQYFDKKHDPSKVLGQDNYFYYVPHKLILFRLQANDDLTDVLRVIAAAKICGTSLIISSSSENFSKNSNVFIESDEQFSERLIPNSRVRLLSIPSTKLTFALANAAANVILAPVLANGRLELLNYLREVSLSVDTHRYGNLSNTLP